MADATAINTCKKSDVNKRLEQFFIHNMGRDIHVLECLFHVNEIDFNHIVQEIKGKKKGPATMKEESIRNGIDNLKKTIQCSCHYAVSFLLFQIHPCLKYNCKGQA